MVLNLYFQVIRNRTAGVIIDCPLLYSCKKPAVYERGKSLQRTHSACATIAAEKTSVIKAWILFFNKLILETSPLTEKVLH
jgi:hypothetical protein